MADVSSTDIQYALKSIWPQKRIEMMTFKNQPFMALVPKDPNFRGRDRQIAVQYAPTPGASAAFATAQANKGSHKGKAFTVTHIQDFAVAAINGLTLEQAKGDENCLFDALENETKAAILAVKRSMGIAMYRSGTGTIGRGATLSTNTITLATTQDIVNFEVGMVVGASTADGSSARTGTSTITAVDRAAGTFTITASDITSLSGTDYFFRAGDMGTTLKMKGLAAWLPTTAPDSTSFFGVDRSSDTTRLGGVRYDASAAPPAEGLVVAANAIGLEGGSPDHFFCHFQQYTNIVNDLGSKVQYVDASAGEIGFKAVMINGPTGPIKVLPDVNCPYGLGYMLQLDTWTLASAGPAPHILDADGLKNLREYNADGIEFRVGMYGQLYCDAPGWNAVVTMPT